MHKQIVWMKCQTLYFAAGGKTYISQGSSSFKQKPSLSKALLSRSVIEPSRAWDVAWILTTLTTLTTLTMFIVTQTRVFCFYLITSPLITNKAALKRQQQQYNIRKNNTSSKVAFSVKSHKLPPFLYRCELWTLLSCFGFALKYTGVLISP